MNAAPSWAWVPWTCEQLLFADSCYEYKRLQTVVQLHASRQWLHTHQTSCCPEPWAMQYLHAACRNPTPNMHVLPVQPLCTRHPASQPRQAKASNSSMTYVQSQWRPQDPWHLALLTRDGHLIQRKTTARACGPTRHIINSIQAHYPLT